MPPTTDPTNPAEWIPALILWLYRAFCPDPDSPTNLRHLADVLGLRAFAGALWHDATTGLAHWWAIVIDNLLDILDPYPSRRGDH